MQEARTIFDTIINNRIFERISVILFLNKVLFLSRSCLSSSYFQVDLLKQKVGRSNIGDYIEEFG